MLDLMGLQMLGRYQMIFVQLISLFGCPDILISIRCHSHYGYRYDPIGVGKSTINDLTVQVEDWLDSALAMVDNICDKDVPIIIVSSSVGSWVRFEVIGCA